MLPLAVVGLIEQGLRLLNNWLEGQTPEQRQAGILIGWAIAKPILWPFLPQETKEQVVNLMGAKNDA